MNSNADELLYLADQQAHARARYNEDDAGLIRESKVIEWALRQAALRASAAPEEGYDLNFVRSSLETLSDPHKIEIDSLGLDRLLKLIDRMSSIAKTSILHLPSALPSDSGKAAPVACARCGSHDGVHSVCKNCYPLLIAALAPATEGGPAGTSFSEEETYALFLILDTLARIRKGKDKTVNYMRERTLPAYREWHKQNPFTARPAFAVIHHFTREEVVRIKNEPPKRGMVPALAKEFGVSTATIYRIRLSQSYSHFQDATSARSPEQSSQSQNIEAG